MGMIQKLGLLVCAALLSTCGASGGPEDVDAVADTAITDLSADLTDLKTQDATAAETSGTRLDILPDTQWYTFPDNLGHDAPWDLASPDSSPEDSTNLGFALGAVCGADSDCLHGLCLESFTGPRCVGLCEPDGSCPDGFACAVWPATGEELCIPSGVNLCRPCISNEECSSSGADVGDRCVELGDVGAYCGTRCLGTIDCPPGFGCYGVYDISGTATNQCVKNQGECACSPPFVEAGASTSCYRENGFGRCVGERVCTDEGLTACSADTPASEECNGVDDNCDGTTDEDCL